MAGFPPASGNKKPASDAPNGNPVQMNSTPTSTGGSLKASIAMKDKSVVAQPVAEKTTDLF